MRNNGSISAKKKKKKKNKLTFCETWSTSGNSKMLTGLDNLINKLKIQDGDFNGGQHGEDVKGSFLPHFPFVPCLLVHSMTQ